MVAVRNRVLLGRGDYAFVAHVDLGFFVATSSKGDVLIGSSIHCAHGDVLLAFALFSIESRRAVSVQVGIVLSALEISLPR